MSNGSAELDDSISCGSTFVDRRESSGVAVGDGEFASLVSTRVSAFSSSWSSCFGGRGMVVGFSFELIVFVVVLVDGVGGRDRERRA